jgi:ectoine hydroxylase-related dioxygenase (phytanoyl-CoA dioxygenase family)
VDGYKPVHCRLHIGDVLLLNKHIIHASMPNHSIRTRFSIDFRFFGARDHSHKHYLDMQTWNVIAPGEDA